MQGGGGGTLSTYTEQKFSKKKLHQGSSFRSKTTAINRSPDLRKKTYTNCFLGTYFRSFQVFLMRNSPRRTNFKLCMRVPSGLEFKALALKIFAFWNRFRTDIGKVKGRVAYEPQDTHRPNIPPPPLKAPPLNAWLCHADESKQGRNCCPWLAFHE